MSKPRTQAPSAVDPVQTAGAQSASNKDTAVAQANLNMVNQYTPFGSLEYSQRGTAADGTPQYAATQTLTPIQQQIADEAQKASLNYGLTGNALLDSVKGSLSQPVDLSSLGTSPVYDAAFRDSQRTAMINRAQGDWDQRRQGVETQLAGQGLTPGTAAYDNAYKTMYSNPYNDFLMSADINAGNAASSEYARQQSSRQNSINELLLPRQNSINELSALLSGAQVTSPSYVNTPQTGISQTDVLGAYGTAQGAQNAAYQGAVSQNNAAMGGLAGLGGALGGGYLASGGRFW